MFICQTILACAGLARYGPAPTSWWACAYSPRPRPTPAAVAASDVAHPELVLSVGPLAPQGMAAPFAPGWQANLKRAREPRVSSVLVATPVWSR
jgi:hypothetical protein